MFCAIGVLAASLALASGEREFSIFAGSLLDADTSETTAAWQLQYLQAVGKTEAVSFSWLNEGHLNDDHRDGPCAQLWLRSKVFTDRLTLGVGVGPYYYLDTTQTTDDGPFFDEHGWGAVLSFDAGWQLNDRWLAHLRYNFVDASSAFDTRTINLGLGYLLPPQEGVGAEGSTAAGEWAKREEVDLLGGVTIVNSFESERSTAWYADYRHSFSRYFDWTVGVLHEGDPRMARRNGLVAQVWGRHALCGGLWTLGLGAGAYWAVDKRSGGDGAGDDESLSGILTMSATRRLGADWLARISWSRIVTGYDRDSDIVLVGVGYSLGGTEF
jgi:hypothetical protein